MHLDRRLHKFFQLKIINAILKIYWITRACKAHTITLGNIYMEIISTENEITYRYQIEYIIQQ